MHHATRSLLLLAFALAPAPFAAAAPAGGAPPDAASAAGGADDGTSWLETVQAGGPVAYLILGLSVVALALAVMHLWQIRRAQLLPPRQLQMLDSMLGSGDVDGAVAYCREPANDSFLVRTLGAGLARYQQSAFGAFELKDAIEEAGEEQVARLYRSTDAIGVIGSIAPLMGLLGTVLGMVGAFESLSRAGASDHEALATNISLALVTTLLGLILAIPCIALFTFFRNRIDALAAEASGEIERLALHLERAGGKGAGAATSTAGGRPSSPPARSAATGAGAST